MTLGQEFHGFATTLGYDHQRLTENAKLLSEMNMGATAIGTGHHRRPRLRGGGRAAPQRDHGARPRDRRPTSSSPRATPASFMPFSASLKRNAIKLSKICNDLRLLSSGPQAGFGEINLPPRQAGSSIMPGKVNPVIPEVVNQVAFAVAGADVTVTMAAEGGQLQLNAFEPVIAHSLLQSITWMRRGMQHPARQLRRRHHREHATGSGDGRRRRVGVDHRAHPVHRVRRGSRHSPRPRC